MMSCRQVLLVVAALCWLSASAATEGLATSYSPFTREDGPAARAVRPGAVVYLFSSGTDESRSVPAAGDLLTLVEDAPRRSGRATTSVRVISRAGTACLRGELLEGRVRIHDRFARNGVLFLVVPAAVCLH